LATQIRPLVLQEIASYEFNSILMILTNLACQFCHNRPKFVDGAKTHDFCSKACARTAFPQRKGSSIGKSSQPSASSQPTNAQSHNTPPAVCQAPGCTNPPHPGHDYCSIAHKKFIAMPSLFTYSTNSLLTVWERIFVLCASKRPRWPTLIFAAKLV